MEIDETGERKTKEIWKKWIRRQPQVKKLERKNRKKEVDGEKEDVHEPEISEIWRNRPDCTETVKIALGCGDSWRSGVSKL